MPPRWDYRIHDRQFGPVPFDELQHLASTGQGRPDDLVWRSGAAAWIPARAGGGLFPGESELPEVLPVHPPAPPRRRTAPAPRPRLWKVAVPVAGAILLAAGGFFLIL